MRILMQLLIETCEFPNNTSPGRLDGEEELLPLIQAQEACFVNHARIFPRDTRGLNERRYRYPYRHEQSDLKPP
jgi:hypothetical protein